jgi:outer membrane protein OmpA-like peptidoglycan-associated protein
MLSVLLVIVTSAKLSAQDQKVIDENANYVVIGAFNVYTNAVHFAESAKKQNVEVEYAFSENKKLYYVYTAVTKDHKIAIDQAKKLQAQAQYPDAWVYGKPSEAALVAVDINPGTNKETTITPVDRPVVDKPVVVAETPKVVVPITFSSAPVPPPSEKAKQNDETGKWYYFKVYSSVTGDSVNGGIDLINVETNKKSASYKTNTSVFVKPTNKSGEVLFACEILGYRPIRKNVNYDNPLVSTEVTQIKEENDQFVLPFELVRLKKGDIVVMYDLFFYKDAAIIRPESRSEVGLLVDMMKENLKYKIRLHGHTNGGGSGKIIMVGADKNFFSLSGSKDGFGSAMKLSQERADIVKEYLLAQGISEDRIETKAWAGKKPLYDVEHALAQSNVRVEVEILED